MELRYQLSCCRCTITHESIVDNKFYTCGITKNQCWIHTKYFVLNMPATKMALKLLKSLSLGFPYLSFYKQVT